MNCSTGTVVLSLIVPRTASMKPLLGCFVSLATSLRFNNKSSALSFVKTADLKKCLISSKEESTVAFWASSNFLVRLITSSILRPSLKQNETSLRIQHKYAYLPHTSNDWNTQESIVLSINKMNSPRGVSASLKRIKMRTSCLITKLTTKTKNLKIQKNQQNMCEIENAKNLLPATQAKVKCHSWPHRQKLNFIFFGHTGKNKLHSHPHRKKLNFILGHTGKIHTNSRPHRQTVQNK